MGPDLRQTGRGRREQYARDAVPVRMGPDLSRTGRGRGKQHARDAVAGG
jgi:hypothetical protein